MNVIEERIKNEKLELVVWNDYYFGTFEETRGSLIEHQCPIEDFNPYQLLNSG